MLIIWTIIKNIIGGFIEKIMALFNWCIDHPKITAAIIVIALTFGGGMKWQQHKNEKTIEAIHAIYKEKDRQREEAIDERISEIEKDAKDKAEEVKKKQEKAEITAKNILEEGRIEREKKAKRIVDLIAKITALEKQGIKPEDSRIKEIEIELAGLKMIYGLSSTSVTTINKLVEAYQQ